MRIWRAILRQEWRLQWRSVRFRIALAVYLPLSNIANLILFFGLRHRTEELIEGHSYLALLLLAQPWATAVLTILVVGNQSSRQALTEQWIPLASSSIGHAGYLIRRWLAQQVLILPWTLAPLLMAWGLAWTAGSQSIDLQTWGMHWAFMVLPVPPAVGALWLGMVILAGNELVAVLFAGLGLQVMNSVIGRVFFSWHLAFGGFWNGLRQEALNDWLGHATFLMQRSRDLGLNMVGTQGATDMAGLWQWVTIRYSGLYGMSALILCLASVFLGRTRRDLQPLVIHEAHSLRSYIGLFNRLRQRYAPDAGLAGKDRLCILVSALLLVLAIGHQGHIQSTFHGQATERYTAAKEWPVAPLPTDLDVLDWSVQGEITPAATVESVSLGTLRYRGAEPLKRLVFTLNAGLDVIEVDLDGRQGQQHRAWDRWAFDLTRPLQDGDQVTLKVRVEGRPAHPFFGLYRGNTYRSFVDGYESNQAVRFRRYLHDFSATRPSHSVTGRRVDLQPGDLGPIPRFTTWKLTPPTRSATEFGQQVPEETFPVFVDMKVRLEGPSSWLLGDACGQRSQLQNGRSLLEGQCRTALTGYVVRGGQLEILEGSSEDLALAVLPGHRARGEALLESLATVASVSDRAWPGLPGLQGLLVLEWAPPFDIDLLHDMKSAWWRPLKEDLHGSLLSLPEGLMVSPEPIRADLLVGRFMARDLLRRRAIEPSQMFLFQQIFAALTVRRMGLDEQGAVITIAPWDVGSMRRPILGVPPEVAGIYERRLPAVLAEAEHRVGSHRFYDAVDAFLNSTEEVPGTIEELFNTLEEASGVDLERFFQQHFLEAHLPNLRLVNVRRQALEGRRWEVRGALANVDSGQAICPVVVMTETHEEQVVVQLEDHGEAPFSITTSSEPLRVVLDPQKTCFRAQIGKNFAALERVDLVGTEAQP